MQRSFSSTTSPPPFLANPLSPARCLSVYFLFFMDQKCPSLKQQTIAHHQESSTIRQLAVVTLHANPLNHCTKFVLALSPVAQIAQSLFSLSAMNLRYESTSATRSRTIATT
jgi:hypothetical protein